MPNIRLDQIRDNAAPIRTTRDQEKLDELAQSIKEQGVIVPIKVRPVEGMLDPCPIHGYGALIEIENASWDWIEVRDCIHCGWIIDWPWHSDDPDIEAEPFEEPPIRKPFEVVYGHRRVAAVRLAGLDAIPAIVEGVDDTDSLLQAWIENVHREDMSVDDKADAIWRIKQATGWSNMEMERRGVAPEGTISDFLTYRSERESGAIPPDIRRPNARDQGFKKAIDIKRAFSKAGIEDTTLKRMVNEKVAPLHQRDARKYADAVAQAEDDAERQAILETDPDDPAFEQLVRAKASVKRKAERRERKERQENSREVKEFLDAIRSFNDVIETAKSVAKYDKFSPEAKRFTVGWIDGLIRELEDLKQILGEEE